ncbi:wax ester/triacylglycerol synthase domain-containing protein [Microbacterium sp. LWH3-1.2]|uniref:wax ester/triacylglycerol synthase domain-containing protein n=1 Tax=Microbacterium sp. LWH3-1.2 TaxID=3135256 RepID=UPI0034471114
MRREEMLRPVDEANLVLDHSGQVNVFLIAGLLGPGGFVFEHGGLDLVVLREAVRRRIADIPALCQVPVPVGRRHEWAERQPDLRLHVRLLPRIDDLSDLELRCAELMVEPLPRSRPLWELLVAPTPAGAAVIFRIHHAIADGIAAAEVVRRLLDDDAHSPAPPVQPPAPRSSPMDRLGAALFGVRRTVTTLTARGLPDTVLLGARSCHHGVIFADADLERIRATAHGDAATVNDAILAVAAAGYRAALTQAGGPMPAELPVSVPVALERRGASRNQVGVMLVRLPLDAASPHEALARIAAQTRIQKVQARQQGTLELMRGPLGARVMDRIAHRQHLVGGFVTNVPGPDHRLSMAGAALLQLWPVAVLAANVRLGVAAVSYAGRLCLGVHFDAGYLDEAVVSAAIRRELVALTS